MPALLCETALGTNKVAMSWGVEWFALSTVNCEASQPTDVAAGFAQRQ